VTVTELVSVRECVKDEVRDSVASCVSVDVAVFPVWVISSVCVGDGRVPVSV